MVLFRSNKGIALDLNSTALACHAQFAALDTHNFSARVAMIAGIGAGSLLVTRSHPREGQRDQRGGTEWPAGARPGQARQCGFLSRLPRYRLSGFRVDEQRDAQWALDANSRRRAPTVVRKCEHKRGSDGEHLDASPMPAWPGRISIVQARFSSPCAALWRKGRQPSAPGPVLTAFTSSPQIGGPAARASVGAATSDVGAGSFHALSPVRPTIRDPRQQAICRTRGQRSDQQSRTFVCVLGTLQELRKKISKCEVVHTYLPTKVLNINC
jgi:hypothetical protein